MKIKRGRNQTLLLRRNLKILERFIYWTEEQRLRSDDAIKILAENEFFLTEQTIMSVLNKAYSIGGKKQKVVFHQPQPPQLTEELKNLLIR